MKTNENHVETSVRTHVGRHVGGNVENPKILHSWMDSFDQSVILDSEKVASNSINKSVSQWSLSEFLGSARFEFQAHATACLQNQLNC